MEIEFECGHTANNVGIPSMAIRAHVGQCNNQACQAELLAEAFKTGSFNPMF